MEDFASSPSSCCQSSITNLVALTPGMPKPGAIQIVPSASIVPATIAPPLDLSDYVVDPLFAPLPIAYHPTYRFYFCTLCRHGIHDLRYHFGLKGAHQREYPKYFLLLPAILVKYPAADDPNLLLSPNITHENPHPKHIPLIHSADIGYRCHHCDFTTSKRGTILSHISNKHPGHGPSSCSPCPNVQSFSHNKNGRWFPSSSLIAPSSTPITDLLLRQAAPEVAEPHNPEVSSGGNSEDLLPIDSPAGSYQRPADSRPAQSIQDEAELAIDPSRITKLELEIDSQASHIAELQRDLDTSRDEAERENRVTRLQATVIAGLQGKIDRMEKEEVHKDALLQSLLGRKRNRDEDYEAEISRRIQTRWRELDVVEEARNRAWVQRHGAFSLRQSQGVTARVGEESDEEPQEELEIKD